MGSLNLAAFVQDKSFMFGDFREAVSIATRALNEVLDEGIDLHPLQEQRDSVRDWRQIGLGVMGVADMLIKMDLTYGSKEAIELCDHVAFNMADEAIRESALLAMEQGAFPKCNIEEITTTPFFIANTRKTTADLVKKYGMRNSQILTIAPTGTLSTMLGISGGVEPIFATSYTRKTESLHGKEVSYKVYTPIVEQYMEQNGIKDEADLPPWFVTAQNLHYEDRIKMQSVWQSHIDASISSTVNVPNDFTVEQVEDLYMKAWQHKLKGITLFREGCARAGVLTTDNIKIEEDTKSVTYNSIEPVSRKEIGTTHGNTYCKKCACGTLYITVNKDSNYNVVESFVHTSKGGICQANIGAINRMVSLSLRSGVKVDEIVDQLKGITCPACVKSLTRGDKVDGISCPDILSKTLMEFYNDATVESAPVALSKPVENKAEKVNELKCPECGSGVKHEGGCWTCLSCGYSKCG